jgi:hypothetical protein
MVLMGKDGLSAVELPGKQIIMLYVKLLPALVKPTKYVLLLVAKLPRQPPKDLTITEFL